MRQPEKVLLDQWSPIRRSRFSEVSPEMFSYGLRKANVRKDLRLIHEHLQMGSYTAGISAVLLDRGSRAPRFAYGNAQLAP